MGLSSVAARPARPARALLPAALLALGACVPAGDGTGGGTAIVTPFGFYVAAGGESKDNSASQGAETMATALAAGALIADQLRKVWDECGTIGAAEYRVDCLGEGYGRVARDIPADETFRDARTAVATAGRRLEALAAANAAPALPAIRGGKRSRPVRAVAPDRRRAVESEAAAILAETETVLLRSSAADPVRQAAFQKIVQAVNSAKVLLRS